MKLGQFLPQWSWMTLIEDRPGWAWLSQIQGIRCGYRVEFQAMATQAIISISIEVLVLAIYRFASIVLLN